MFKLGKKVFIRTVTFHYVGEVAQIDDTFVTLKDAAWVADSGRFFNALDSGSLNEVEPYPDGVAVAIGAVVDVAPWNHELPLDQQ